MISIDNITTAKNKKNLHNDNISFFKDTLNSLKTKKFNVNKINYKYYINIISFILMYI